MPRLVSCIWAPLSACVILTLASCQGAKPPPEPATAGGSPVSSSIDPSTIDWEHSLRRRLHGPHFAVSPSGDALALISGNDLNDFEISAAGVSLHRFHSDGQALIEVAFSPDGARLGTVEVGMSGPGQIFLLTRNKTAPASTDNTLSLQSTCNFPYDVWSLVFSKDSQYVSAQNETAYAWSAVDGKLIGHQDSSPQVAIQLEIGLHTVTRSLDRQHLICNNGRRKVEMQKGVGIFHQDFGGLSERGVGGADDRSFCIWDAETGKLRLRIEPGFERGILINTPAGESVYFPNDGKNTPSERLINATSKPDPEGIASLLRDLLGDKPHH
jgi:WD40 repeat protein